MEDCCTASGCDSPRPGKARCPVSGRECASVPVRTLLHHLRRPWAWQASASRYYYCDDPACEIAYFGDDGSLIPQTLLRTRIGAKDASGDAVLCYCFGVSRADYADDPATRDFVIAQTRAGACACETRNPSGRCCLKDFPAAAD
ncbi:MAG: hypothetical protein LDL19_07145 [Thiobacillus sp.]|nr:hypothetical protein [Thiobacillus sp.]